MRGLRHQCRRRCSPTQEGQQRGDVGRDAELHEDVAEAPDSLRDGRDGTASRPAACLMLATGATPLPARRRRRDVEHGRSRDDDIAHRAARVRCFATASGDASRARRCGSCRLVRAAATGEEIGGDRRFRRDPERRKRTRQCLAGAAAVDGTVSMGDATIALCGRHSQEPWRRLLRNDQKRRYDERPRMSVSVTHRDRETQRRASRRLGHGRAELAGRPGVRQSAVHHVPEQAHWMPPLRRDERHRLSPATIRFTTTPRSGCGWPGAAVTSVGRIASIDDRLHNAHARRAGDLVRVLRGRRRGHGTRAAAMPSSATRRNVAAQSCGDRRIRP